MLILKTIEQTPAFILKLRAAMDAFVIDNGSMGISHSSDYRKPMTNIEMPNLLSSLKSELNAGGRKSNSFFSAEKITVN